MLKPVYGVTKRTAIMLWVFSASFLLYFVNLSAGGNVGFFGFISFAFGLVGAGVTYHVAVELVKCRQIESNEAAWRGLLVQMGKVQLGYVGAGVSLLSGMWIGGIVGYLVALLGMAIFMVIAFHLLVSAKEMILELVGEDGF